MYDYEDEDALYDAMVDDKLTGDYPVKETTKEIEEENEEVVLNPKYKWIRTEY